ncbi:MAG: N-acetyltransferase [Chloroflexi bacterium]|nr:MAG: N-acetyltransferase [Chloroflexota bacterium]
MALDVDVDRVVGVTISMRTDFDPDRETMKLWREATGNGWLNTHNPNGEWLYGVETFVHPNYRGKGIGSQLMDARFALARKLNLRGMIAGGMIMDYHHVAKWMSPEDYVAEVVAGKRFDTNLTKQIAKGFEIGKLIPDYCDDPRSCNYGVTIIWRNPDYRPDTP